MISHGSQSAHPKISQSYQINFHSFFACYHQLVVELKIFSHFKKLQRLSVGGRVPSSALWHPWLTHLPVLVLVAFNLLFPLWRERSRELSFIDFQVSLAQSCQSSLPCSMGSIRGSTLELLLIVQQFCSGRSKWVLTFSPSACYTFFILKSRIHTLSSARDELFPQNVLSACSLLAMLMTLLILWIWRTGKRQDPFRCSHYNTGLLFSQGPILCFTIYTCFERKTPCVFYHVLQLHSSEEIEKKK